MSKQVRLDKFLADAGAGTRSQVKGFLKKGLVTVNVNRPESRNKKYPRKPILSFSREPYSPILNFITIC